MKKQITAILCLALAVCTVFSCVSCSVRISASEISLRLFAEGDRKRNG